MAVFDEMLLPSGNTRDIYLKIKSWLEESPPELLISRREQAETLFRRIGITFAVYSENEAQERLIPFDLIPRIFTYKEWNYLEEGLVQRVKALNFFLNDIYGKADIIKAGIIPPELIFKNSEYLEIMKDISVPHAVHVHIAGIDIVRVDEKDFFVLEDNVRTPSGVSYMIENREAMLRLFPELFYDHKVAPVDNYPDMLLASLRSVAPCHSNEDTTVVLLTPGQYNSAYYEHSFLADKIGIELVEGSDLFVRDNFVYMRTTQGAKKVDVIYKRIDDQFIDPQSFNKNSVLGVPGLISAYKSGNVTLANAVGNGIADDKAIYTYMPEILKFYLSEEPILKNVPTWRCREKSSMNYVLENLKDLVVKEVNGSGGYGMLVGPHANKSQLEDFTARIKAKPDNYIAQPTLALSTCPTMVEKGIAPRHVDLRPFVLTGSDGVRVVPGGLTRVAIKEGSLVVNSSQGGGTKDTWIIE